MQKSIKNACTDGVNKLYDHVLAYKLNVILDGTFAYASAIQNVERSLKRDRSVEIYYLYQDPVISWSFTKSRETVEHRNVPKEVFVNSFFASRKQVDEVKSLFPRQVVLNLVINDYEQGLESLRLNVDSVETLLESHYTADQLEQLLK